MLGSCAGTLHVQVVIVPAAKDPESEGVDEQPARGNGQHQAALHLRRRCQSLERLHEDVDGHHDKSGTVRECSENLGTI